MSFKIKTISTEKRQAKTTMKLRQSKVTVSTKTIQFKTNPWKIHFNSKHQRRIQNQKLQGKRLYSDRNMNVQLRLKLKVSSGQWNSKRGPLMS